MSPSSKGLAVVSKYINLLVNIKWIFFCVSILPMYEYSYQINVTHLASKDAMVSVNSPVTTQKQGYLELYSSAFWAVQYFTHSIDFYFPSFLL